MVVVKTAAAASGRRLLVALMTGLLLLTAGRSFGEPAADPASTDHPTDAVSPKSADDPQRQVVLYYLHGTRRCKTCRSIESYAKGVVNTRFADALESGALAWKVVDYDKQQNRHFIQDFGLFTSSLVVVETERGEIVEFEVLHEAWSLVKDKTRFQQYVYRALRAHLG